MSVVAVVPRTVAPNPAGPAANAFAVTPSDTDQLATITRKLWVGGAGNVVVILANDSAAVTITGVPAGTMLDLAVKQVMATNTTATAIVGLY